MKSQSYIYLQNMWMIGVETIRINTQRLSEAVTYILITDNKDLVPNGFTQPNLIPIGEVIYNGVDFKKDIISLDSI